ncbi:hypothetical protein [Mucilaginibacter sp.]|uniref:hypothetical protein n=1 Tax=Mucilaginibacter sp. TaxID=1882438 RepID=UPI003D108120
MTKKEAIESIKNATKAIGMLFYVEDQKFEAVKVKDGSQDVSIEGEYAKGTKVSVSSVTGSIPAPDGNYTLSNGQSFATKGGMIDEIMEGASDDSDEHFAKKAVAPAKKEEAPADAVEEASESPAEAASEVDEDGDAVADNANTAALQALADKINEMDSMISAIKDALAGKASKQDMSVIADNFKAIESAFEVLSDTPAEFSKVDNSVLAKEDKVKKLEALAQLMGKK